MIRKIRNIRTAVPTLEGAGVHLHRAFGYHQSPDYDPFLMLDDFRNDDPQNYLAGFPWHPHRGIETITYMLLGSAEHKDSLGNSGTIHKGEVQWMTAGRGIIHQEMPKPDADGKMYGFQIWTNLPATEKMCPPRYRDLRAKDIPVVHSPEGSEVKIISGEYLGIRGALEDIYIKPQYWDLKIPADTMQRIDTPQGFTCFIYVYEGSLSIEQKEIHDRQLVLFEDGDEVCLCTKTSACRMLFLCGKPLKEPISWRGPIVMNTAEEIKLAFQELERGTFIKA